MRREELYLSDIVESAEAINKFVSGKKRAVHAYFSVDWNIVWISATVNAPALREKIVKILGG